MSDLHLRVISPDRTVFDRPVASVSFMGVDGEYGILPRHAPLMTATKPGIATIKNTDGTSEDMIISSGFAEVRDNVLTLVCEAGEMADEVDLERAIEAEKRAREALDKDPSEVDLPRAEAALRRAMLRQMIARKQGGTGHV